LTFVAALPTLIIEQLRRLLEPDVSLCASL
jgi:hypothetical protein